MTTEARRARIDNVAAARSAFVSIALDGVFDGHNVAAILRSADAFGVCEVHAVENGREAMRINRKIARGTQNWVDLYRWPDRMAMLRALRERGYAVWVAAGEPGGVDLSTWMPARPTAFLFGNEHRGVSDELRAEADAIFRIPMVGMVESLNVSVAAAITLYVARQAIERARPDLRLDDAARAELVTRWLRREERTPA